MEDAIKTLDTWQVVVFLAMGLAILLGGYRIKKIAFFIIWFLIGVRATTYLLPTINSMVPAISENGLWQNLIPIAGGLLLALLGFTIEKLCIGGICFGLTMIITVQYFGTDIQTLAIGGVIGIIVAGLTVAMMKPAIIIVTAAAGSYALTMGILTLTPISSEIYYFPLLLGIASVGAIFQFATSKGLS